MYTYKMCELLHVSPELVPGEISGVSSRKGELILSLLLFAVEDLQVSVTAVEKNVNLLTGKNNLKECVL